MKPQALSSGRVCSGVAFFAGLLVATTGAAEPPVRQAAEAAHHEMWARFIDPHGTLYDFTELDGRVPLPTPEECADGKPNALGWWTPIENGGFFGGLYLDALCNRWAALKTPAAAAEARKVAGGLLRLAEVGGAPGFIARGFATDGHSHYTASSSDQTYPWFYGMWRYARSGIPAADERQRVIATLERVAAGLEANGWKMPGDRPGFGNFGHWSGGFAGTKGIFSGAEPQFDAAARFLFVLRSLYELTGKERWRDQYAEALHGKPSGSERTRLEICAGGVAYVAPGQPPRYPESPPLWTSASSQAALRALRDMEESPEIRVQFQRGLDTNAANATPFVAGYRDYDNRNDLKFDADWRKLNESWKPQPEIAGAVELGTYQYRLWNKQSPRRRAEADLMRDPLFAAWVVTLSDNPKLIAAARADIDQALLHFEWSRLYTSFFFMAECVHWQAAAQAK